MTNTTCCGGIIREDEASESYPYRAPERTEKCYRGTSSESGFDYDMCQDRLGTGENCCQDGEAECVPNIMGGYCNKESGTDYYYIAGNHVPISNPSAYWRMLEDELGDLQSQSRRERRRRDRRIDEREELNILAEGNIIREGSDQTRDESSTIRDPISNMIANMGVALGIVIILLSIIIILIKHRIIKFK
jgi:hypothetical protein